MVPISFFIHHEVLVWNVLICVALFAAVIYCRPATVEDEHEITTYLNNPCGSNFTIINTTHTNITDIDSVFILQSLSTRVMTIITESEDQLNKTKSLLKSHFTKDCVESLTPDLDLELQCDNLTLQVDDEFKSCLESIFKTMTVISTSIEHLNQWNTEQHFIDDHIDISNLGRYADQLICEVFIDILPLNGSGSKLLKIVPQPMRLISDLTDKTPNMTSLDLKYFDNRKCGTLDTDAGLNEIQRLHFIYQFIHSVYEISKRIHTIISQISHISVDQVSLSSSNQATPFSVGSDVSIASMSRPNIAATRPFDLKVILVGRK